MQDWATKCASLEKESPEALSLLYHLAYWKPDSLPKILIYALQKDQSALERLLDILIRHSFIVSTSDDQFQIEEALQAILQSRIENFEPLQTVLKVTLEQCDFDQYRPENYPRTKSLLPQIDYLMAYISELSSESLAQEIDISSAKLTRVLGEYLGRVEHKWQIALIQFKNVETFLHKVHGDHDHIDLIQNFNDQAVAYWQLKDYPCLLTSVDNALAMFDRLFEKAHIHPEKANSLNLKGIYFSLMNQPDDAALLYHEALDIRKRVYGQEHPEVARSLNNLFAHYSKLGQYQKAEEFISEALTIQESLYGARLHPEIARSLHNLANVNIKLKKFHMAKTYAQQALKMATALYGEAHPQVITELNILAELEVGEQRGAMTQLPHFAGASATGNIAPRPSASPLVLMPPPPTSPTHQSQASGSGIHQHPI